jgi:hypothetical protein
MNEPELNYRATIIWDDMTTVVENGVEVSRVYKDNSIRLDLYNIASAIEEYFGVE